MLSSYKFCHNFLLKAQQGSKYIPYMNNLRPEVAREHTYNHVTQLLEVNNHQNG